MIARWHCIAAALAVNTLAGRAQTSPQAVRLALKADTVIDGVWCAPTGRARAGFHASGRLESCPLARDTTIAGHALAKETWIYLDDAGRLRRAWLPRNTQLGGHVCRGTGYKGWSVEFHPGGALQACFLADVEVIDGVPCEKGTFWHELSGPTIVRWREDGGFAECKAARDFTRNGTRVKKGTRVHG